MGLGLLGRGIGDVKFLLQAGARVTVTDLKTRKELKESINEIERFYRKIRIKRSKSRNQNLRIYKINYVLGRHRAEDFENCDLVLKAAGVAKDSRYLVIARERKIPIAMDDSLFAVFCPCPIIGVTGTRGKTTTATLIAEILKSTGRRVFLAGNIPGLATLPLIKKVKKEDLVVLELSSWQLQGWAEERISPGVAVITNIYPDHLNYYHHSLAKYLADKKAIYRYQKAGDHLILNQNNPYSQKFSHEARGKVIWFSSKDLPGSWRPKILGEHNRENIAAAVKVGLLFKVPLKKIKLVVEKFWGVPGREEMIREFEGVKYFNDTTATMPEATLAALSTLVPAGRKNIILIAGGADKGLDFRSLARKIKSACRAVILFEGLATKKLEPLLADGHGPVIFKVSGMGAAVARARRLARRGEIVLLSPAAASFDLFANEYDRGEQFKEAVFNLK